MAGGVIVVSRGMVVGKIAVVVGLAGLAAAAAAPAHATVAGLIGLGGYGAQNAREPVAEKDAEHGLTQTDRPARERRIALRARAPRALLGRAAEAVGRAAARVLALVVDVEHSVAIVVDVLDAVLAAKDARMNGSIRTSEKKRVCESAARRLFQITQKIEKCENHRTRRRRSRC